MKNSTFNLAPPPNFRGLDPNLPLTVYQRHLPHWRQRGATYFVTFRLGDSLPQDKLNFLKSLRAQWEKNHPEPRSEKDWTEYAREFTRQVERWLDEGLGVCHFRQARWADDLRQRLHHFQDERYRLSCWAIMPNHCHLVICPKGDHELEDLVGAMKGISARNINKSLGTNGSVWEEESYDRIVRDEEHLWHVIQYVGRNPRMAGLENKNWMANVDSSGVGGCGLEVRGSTMRFCVGRALLPVCL